MHTLLSGSKFRLVCTFSAATTTSRNFLGVSSTFPLKNRHAVATNCIMLKYLSKHEQIDQSLGNSVAYRIYENILSL
jgi:hypothetical protein